MPTYKILWLFTSLGFFLLAFCLESTLAMSDTEKNSTQENLAEKKDPWEFTYKKYGLKKEEIHNPDPEEFRFEHYAYVGVKVMAEALSCMFPQGTQRSFFDHILIDQAGATHQREFIPKAEVSQEKVVHKYFYEFEVNLEGQTYPIDYKVTAKFDDKNDKLTEINVAGTGVEPCKK